MHESTYQCNQRTFPAEGLRGCRVCTERRGAFWDTYVEEKEEEKNADSQRLVMFDGVTQQVSCRMSADGDKE